MAKPDNLTVLNYALDDFTQLPCEDTKAQLKHAIGLCKDGNTQEKLAVKNAIAILQSNNSANN